MSKTVARAYGLYELTSGGLKSRLFLYRPEGSQMEVKVEVSRASEDVVVRAKVRGARSQASAVNWASRVLWLLSLYLSEEGR